nr:kinesin-like protein KIN-14Q [Tanacetum cinerariifolium]
GQAKTLIFIHVSPDPDTVGETVTTLNFAERVSTVELGAGKSNNGAEDLKKLKEQVTFLKALKQKSIGSRELVDIVKSRVGYSGSEVGRRRAS